MIQFPRTFAEVEAALVPGAVLRAGNTELGPRRRLGLDTGPLVDLRDLPGFDAVEVLPDGGLRIGAGLRVAALAAHPAVRAGHPALAQAAASLATPAVRHQASVGGALLQRNRCPYFRHPDLACLQKGGSACLARAGDHADHVCFDLGPCAAPHPSSLAAALLAEDAQVALSSGPPRGIDALLGDGRDPTRDHALPEGALLQAILLPPPAPGVRGATLRATARARAEWPTVEAVVRYELRDGVIHAPRVVLGAVARVPLLRTAAMRALAGRPPGPEAFEAAGRAAAEDARPLPQTAWKVRLIAPLVADALARAAGGAPGAP
jgi:xanthine dehydrogenase YagS FAD-binding subunit